MQTGIPVANVEGMSDTNTSEIRLEEEMKKTRMWKCMMVGGVVDEVYVEFFASHPNAYKSINIGPPPK